MMNNGKPRQKILLAVDGSEHSRAAARLLAELPCSENCDVRAIMVLLGRHGQFALTRQDDLEEVADLLAKQGIMVNTVLVPGSPAEQIVECANEYEPDLIMIGARGLRSTMGILLGGVAQQVVEYARWPVMVVRAPYQGLRRALLITDGSQFSDHAVDFIIHFDLPAGCELHLMHVLAPQPGPELFARAWSLEMSAGAGFSTPEMQERLRLQSEQEEKEGRQILEHTATRLRLAGKPVTTHLQRGDAATEIIDFAQENEIDLIVAGSRGLGAVRGWLLGSVSRKLVHYAGCSVLIVRRPET